MYPQRPQDSFFVRAMLTELVRTVQRITHERRSVDVARTTQPAGRRRLAQRSGSLLRRSTQWLLRPSQ